MSKAWLGSSRQLSLDRIKEPFGPRNSSTGSASTPVSPNLVKEGPRALTITLLETLPVMMNPPIMALSPVCTRARVEMFNDRAGVAVGVEVGVGVGLADGS